MVKCNWGRLAGSFLTGEPAALLVGGDRGVARLETPSGLALVLVADPERLPEVLDQHRSGLMHVVLVGGGESDRARLEAWWPRWQLARRFGFHHVDVNGCYYEVNGPRLALLERAAGRVRSLEPLSEEEVAPFLEASRSLAREEPEQGLPWVNLAISGVCVTLFTLQEIWGGSDNNLALLNMGAGRGHQSLHAPWTILSSAFLHIGFEHLALNMAALFSFGPLLERALGARRYLLLYVGSALGGGLLSAVGHPAIVSAGASGALWGVMVGGAVVVTWPNGLLPAQLAARAQKKVWQPVILNGLYSLQPGIDWLAHLGGGLVGGALIVSGLLMLQGRRWTRVASTVAVLLCVGAIGTALAMGRPWRLGAPPQLERQWTGLAGVSLLVPNGLAVEREAASVVYGSLDHDPVAIEVRHGAAELDAEGMQREWKKLPSLFTENVIEGGTIVRAPRETDVGKIHAWVLDVKLKNDLTIRTWGWVVPEGVIVIRVYLMPSAPADWEALRETVIESVRATGAQVD